MKPNELKARAQKAVDGAKEKIAKFAADLVEHPQHTLDFGTSVFHATAMLTVWSQILDSVENGCSLADLVERLEQQVVQNASRVSYSTSIPANILAAETTAAYAEAYRDLKLYLKHEQRTAA